MPSFKEMVAVKRNYRRGIYSTEPTQKAIASGYDDSEHGYDYGNATTSEGVNEYIEQHGMGGKDMIYDEDGSGSEDELINSAINTATTAEVEGESDFLTSANDHIQEFGTDGLVTVDSKDGKTAMGVVATLGEDGEPVADFAHNVPESERIECSIKDMISTNRGYTIPTKKAIATNYSDKVDSHEADYDLDSSEGVNEYIEQAGAGGRDYHNQESESGSDDELINAHINSATAGENMVGSFEGQDDFDPADAVAIEGTTADGKKVAFGTTYNEGTGFIDHANATDSVERSIKDLIAIKRGTYNPKSGMGTLNSSTDFAKDPNNLTDEDINEAINQDKFAEIDNRTGDLREQMINAHDKANDLYSKGEIEQANKVWDEEYLPADKKFEGISNKVDEEYSSGSDSEKLENEIEEEMEDRNLDETIDDSYQ